LIPGESIGTRNAVIPWPRSPGRVRAKTMTDRRVLRVGDPDLLAGDAIAAARSERFGLLVGGVGSASGSDSAKAPIASPRASVPQPALALRLAARVRDDFGDRASWLTDSETATVALARAIASIASA
jgi:hypothetical protein